MLGKGKGFLALWDLRPCPDFLPALSFYPLVLLILAHFLSWLVRQNFIFLFGHLLHTHTSLLSPFLCTFGLVKWERIVKSFSQTWMTLASEGLHRWPYRCPSDCLSHLAGSNKIDWPTWRQKPHMELGESQTRNEPQHIISNKNK